MIINTYHPRKEQKEVLEESFRSRAPSQQSQTLSQDLDIEGFSENTQKQILRKKLMRSNMDRDRNESTANNLKRALETMRAEREEFLATNEELNRQLTLARNLKMCTGDNCTSRDTLLAERQSYDILTNSHKELEMQICRYSTSVDTKNKKIADLSHDKDQLEEKLDDANKRCSMYEDKISRLEDELTKLSSSSSSLQSLKRDYEELKLNKSKMRTEMEYLLDERDTREITLDEIYKQLTDTRKELAALRESDEDLQERYTALVENSEQVAKQHNTAREMIQDTLEMCDFLRKKLTPAMPNLCNKHNVTYNEYQVQTSCPPLIGRFIDTFWKQKK